MPQAKGNGAGLVFQCSQVVQLLCKAACSPTSETLAVSHGEQASTLAHSRSSLNIFYNCTVEMTELLYTVSDMIFFSTVNLSHTFGVYIVLVHGGSDYTYCWT